MLRELVLQHSPLAVFAASVVKASLILAIAQCVVSFRALSAATRHLLLTAAIAAFLLVPLFATIAPALKLELAPTPVAASSTMQQVVVASSFTPEEPHARIDPWIALAAFWAVVAIAIAIRLATSAMRLRRTVASAAASSARLDAILESLSGSRTVRLVCSDGIDVPMIWGVRSGTILLPAEAERWTDEQLRATFIHELAHLQRLDYLTLALMNLVCTLFWFQPQLWLARRRALTLGEQACDDLVVGSGEQASAYASHLLHVTRQLARVRPPDHLLAMSRPSQLEQRMRAILSPSANRHSLGGKEVMLSVVSFVALVVPVAALQFAAKPVVAVDTARPATQPVVASPAVAGTATLAAAPAPQSRPVVAVTAQATTPTATREEVKPEPAVAPTPSVSTAPVADAPPAPIVVAPTPVTPAAAPAAPHTIAILSSSDLTSRPFTRLGKIEADKCTINLKRPVNTGNPALNPAEAVATERLLQKATAKGADAVVDLKCARQIMIGFSCPTSVVCTADAIKFESQ